MKKVVHRSVQTCRCNCSSERDEDKAWLGGRAVHTLAESWESLFTHDQSPAFVEIAIKIEDDNNAAEDDNEDDPEDCELPPITHVCPESAAYQHLQACERVQKPSDWPLERLLELSDHFPIKFPVDSVRCSYLLEMSDVSRESMEHYANSAYPLLHEDVLYLYINFLESKMRFGSAREKDLYSGMAVVDLVHRLLEKRAVTFFGSNDFYLLLNGEKGRGGWEDVGSSPADKEVPPLDFENCLSYHEMKLSAFLTVSSESAFINEGNRNNRGIPAQDPESVQAYGVVVGVIGTRLEKPGFMEWEEVMVTKSQNVKENGFGPVLLPTGTDPNDQDAKSQWRDLWASFYGISPHLPLYDEVLDRREACGKQAKNRYVEISSDQFFDNIIFKKRVGASVETLLLEAQHRAAVAKTKAYVHVTRSPTVYAASPRYCRTSPTCTSPGSGNGCVGDVGNGGLICGRGENSGVEEEEDDGIRVHFSTRSPHARLLKSQDHGKLLVVSYAWDGNALPGNEFWMGRLDSSGDPAEACSSQIAELHNPHINRRKVSGANLHVACTRWGVLHVSEYARKKLQSLR
uniref:Uncharacterized protein n=1 Tax=Timema bartmani TaxID=61472 RepID=A0A7R9F296_9NEOP|nr:unnamed protein product [Timema bartmani]